MHDIKFIRDNAATFDAGLARRGLPPAAADIWRWICLARLATEQQACSNDVTKPRRKSVNASPAARRPRI